MNPKIIKMKKIPILIFSHSIYKYIKEFFLKIKIINNIGIEPNKVYINI